MGPNAASPTVDEVMNQLSALNVAKQIFISAWYKEACGDLFETGTCRVLREISDESREELERTAPLLAEWAKDLTHSRELDGAKDIARVSRREYLHMLAETKDAMGELYERAAALAPPRLEGAFLDLAAIDFRHAVRLRELLRKEYEAYIETRVP